MGDPTAFLLNTSYAAFVLFQTQAIVSRNRNEGVRYAYVGNSITNPTLVAYHNINRRGTCAFLDTRSFTVSPDEFAIDS